MLARHDQPIAAIATAPGRGAVGIVRVSAPSVAAIVAGRLRPRAETARSDLSAVPGGRRQHHRPGPGDPFPGAPLLHRRRRAGAAGPRRAGGAAAAAGALPGSRRRHRPARRREPGEFTQRAFLNDKIDLAQAEAIADLIDASTEAAARSASRSHVGRVLARDPRAARRADPPAHAGRGDAGLPGRGDRLPAKGRRPGPARAAAADAGAGDAARAPGRAAARRHQGGDRRPAQRRQELAAQCAGRAPNWPSSRRWPAPPATWSARPSRSRACRCM